MEEGLKLSGEWEIYIKDLYTGYERVFSVKNKLTKVYQNEIIKGLDGNGESLEIKYFALGTGETAASADDTKLETETFRRQPTQKSVQSGYFQSSLVLLPADAVGHIAEIGVFFGSSATSAADTGLLLSRINLDIDKTSTESIIFSRKDYINI